MPPPRRRESPPCPECKTENTARIIYGLVSMDGEEWEQGIYVAGGCDALLAMEAKYFCHQCHHEWSDEDPMEWLGQPDSHDPDV